MQLPPEPPFHRDSGPLDWRGEINEFRHRYQLIKDRDGEVSDDLLDYLLTYVFSLVRADALKDAIRIVERRKQDAQHDHIGDNAQCYAFELLDDVVRLLR